MSAEPVLNDAPLNRLARGGQGAWDERRVGRDQRPLISSLWPEESERLTLAVGWLFGAVIVLLINILNVITAFHDQPQDGLIHPVVCELSSAVTVGLGLVFPMLVSYWAYRTFPPAWRLLVLHLLGFSAFAAFHIGGAVALRSLIFPVVLGSTYDFGRWLAEVPYELAKDVLGYTVAALTMRFLLRWRRANPVVDPKVTPTGFDIVDGARLVRTQLSDILAVRSAGNYAEFLLSDGRRPLMRTSLGGLQGRLGPQGFVRTHRSWLVNAARVTGLRPEGSGDYVVELGAVEVPLSRRFREALEALRA